MQAPGIGTDFEGEVARAGAGDTEADAAMLKSDRLRRIFSTWLVPQSVTPPLHSSHLEIPPGA